MRWIALLLTGWAMPATAAAADAGFSATTVAGTTLARGPAVAGIAPGGAAVVAATGGGTTSGIVVVSRATTAWRQQRLAASAAPYALRDVQAVVTPRGTAVVAWAQYAGAVGGHVVVAAGPAGATLHTIARIPVGNAFSAYPRLVVLTDGRALLAYRDAPPRALSALRVRTVGAAGVGSARTLARGAGPLAFAAAGRTGALVWLRPFDRRTGGARTMLAMRVDREGRPIEPAYVVTRAAGSAPRVRGGTDGRVLASWLRRGTGSRPAAGVTRSLWPVLRPARLIATPDGSTATDAPALDLAADGSAAATLRTVGGGAFFHVVGAASWKGGEWARRTVLSVSSPMVGSATAVALGGLRSLAIWAEAVAQPGPASYRIVVAERDARGAAVAAQVLGEPYDHSDGRGVAVAHAGARVLIAYGTVHGGFAIAERAR